MKNLFFFFLLSPFFTVAQTAGSPVTVPANFSITGTITGLPDSTMVFLVRPGSNSVLATDYSNKGNFSLFGSIDKPDLYQLSFVGQTDVAEIFLDKSKVAVTGTLAGIKKLNITGSQSHNDFKQYQSRFEAVKTRLNGLVAKINQTEPGASRDSMIMAFEKTKKSVLDQVDLFVKEKPNSPVSPFVVYITSPVNEDIAQLEKRYNLLSEENKAGLYGSEVKKMIEASKVGLVGTVAPDFSQPDSANKPVSLSSFKGKYVLVDFWASWCGPCRMENPAVVAAYNTFKAKNFTILGVSLDQNRDKWLQAIKADNLNWTHVSDLKYWQNAAAQLYHISSIPANMLIDPSGKIIARDLRGDALFSTLQQLLN